MTGSLIYPIEYYPIMNTIQLESILRKALNEDLGFGGLITTAIFDKDHYSTGLFTAKAAGVLAGLPVMEKAYGLLGGDVEITSHLEEGDTLQEGTEIAKVKGPTAALLQGERVILNLLQHLSGIATATKQAVEALNDPTIRVCDTRKTLPGLRMLQKYAVRCGGGFNHRYRLDDGVMVKDNHITAAGGIGRAVARIREQIGPMVRIEVEAENRTQVLEAVEAGADIIMFDNRSPEEVRQLAELVPDGIITEVSGGITLHTIGGYAGTGVDYISLGFLTHTVKALDISFNIE